MSLPLEHQWLLVSLSQVQRTCPSTLPLNCRRNELSFIWIISFCGCQKNHQYFVFWMPFIAQNLVLFYEMCTLELENSLHNTFFNLIYPNLYNNPSYSRILIGLHLWSIRGQTHRWRQRLTQVFFNSSLNQSQFFANHRNQSVCFMLYGH